MKIGRHGAGLEHAFHGALHDDAGRAEPEDASFIGTGSAARVVAPCSMARSTVSRMPIRGHQARSRRLIKIVADTRTLEEPPRSMAGRIRPGSLRADGFHREESQHRAGAGQCFRARTEMGQGAHARNRPR